MLYERHGSAPTFSALHSGFLLRIAIGSVLRRCSILLRRRSKLVLRESERRFTCPTYPRDTSLHREPEEIVCFRMVLDSLAAPRRPAMPDSSCSRRSLQRASLLAASSANLPLLWHLGWPQVTYNDTKKIFNVVDSFKQIFRECPRWVGGLNVD